MGKRKPRTMSEEAIAAMKAKISATQKRNYAEMTEGERIIDKLKRREGMRQWWSEKTPEERSAIGLKAAETRRKNRSKAHGS